MANRKSISVGEDTIHLAGRSCRNKAVTKQEAFSPVASFYSVGRCYAVAGDEVWAATFLICKPHGLPY